MVRQKHTTFKKLKNGKTEITSTTANADGTNTVRKYLAASKNVGKTFENETGSTFAKKLRQRKKK
jgi:hypothetical protein